MVYSCTVTSGVCTVLSLYNTQYLTRGHNKSMHGHGGANKLINMEIRFCCMLVVSRQSNVHTLPFVSANQCSATPAQWLCDPEHWLCLPLTVAVFVMLKPLTGTLSPVLRLSEAIYKTTVSDFNQATYCTFRTFGEISRQVKKRLNETLMIFSVFVLNCH